MIALECDNVVTRITGPGPVLNRISDLLSFEQPGSDHIRRNLPPWSTWDGKTRLLKIKDGVGTFPAGLTNFVIAWCKENEIECSLEDERSVPASCEKFVLKDELIPRSYQVEALETTRKSSRGILLIGTGGGKTATSLIITADKAVPTLFVTPDVGLREQTLAVYRRFLGDQVSDNINSDCPVVVGNIQSLALKKSDAFERFRMLIIDEFHHCLRGDTIVWQAQRGRKKTIKQVYEQFHDSRKRNPSVKSWDGEKFVAKPVTNAFRYKAPEKMKKIVVEDADGKRRVLVVTANHKIFTKAGKVDAGEIRVGDEIMLGYTTRAQAMEKRSRNQSYREHLSDRAKKNNPKRSESTRASQSKKMKKHVENGLPAFGRGKFGNGGCHTQSQKYLMTMLIGSVAEHVVAPGDGLRPYHYKIDVALPDLKLGIEVDGSSHRGREAQDKRKEERLALAGWKIIRLKEGFENEFR